MGSSAPELVLNHLREGVGKGLISSGTRIDSERSLSAELGVSRGSVRESLRKLEALGVVETRPRSGTYFVDFDPYPVLGIAAREPDPEDVRAMFEMRLTIEPGCARLASSRVDSDDLERIGNAMRRMQHCANRGDVGGFRRADVRFHLEITRGTRNPHLIQVLTTAITTMRNSVRVSLEVPGQMERAMSGHRQIFDAISTRQPEWAAAAAEAHLRDAWHFIYAALADLDERALSDQADLDEGVLD